MVNIYILLIKPLNHIYTPALLGDILRRRPGLSTKLVVGAVVVILLIAGIGFFMMNQPEEMPQELVVAIGIDMDTIDPHKQTTTLVFNINRHIYDTLVWFDEEGDVIPWLAEEWSVSRDGLEYTFKLREGVKFNDGTEFDAYDVKANIDRWIDPNVKVPTRSQLGPVAGAEVMDKYTIKIILSEPYSPFLAALANYLMITSEEVIEKFGNETITEAVGTGPYVLAEWEKESQIVLEANEFWWGEELKITRITWKIVKEAGTRVAALRAGDAQVAFLPPAADKENLENDPNIEIFTPVTNRILFIGIMPKGPLEDPRVRQALNYAVDKEAIVENVLFGLGVVADAPIPPHFFGYSKMEPYEYDPDKARQLLREAGYEDGLSLKMIHPTGRYLQDKEVAEAVQAYLAEVGIEVTLETMDWPSFVQNLLKPLDEVDYDLVLVGWGPGVADAHFTLYPQFHSSQIIPNALGIARYSNPEVDQLLDQAMKELDEDVRKDLYSQAIEIIWEDAPWIFLYTQRNLLAVSKNLKGVFIHPGGEMFFFYTAYFE